MRAKALLLVEFTYNSLSRGDPWAWLRNSLWLAQAIAASEFVKSPTLKCLFNVIII